MRASFPSIKRFALVLALAFLLFPIAPTAKSSFWWLTEPLETLLSSECEAPIAPQFEERSKCDQIFDEGLFCRPKGQWVREESSSRTRVFSFQGDIERGPALTFRKLENRGNIVDVLVGVRGDVRTTTVPASNFRAKSLCKEPNLGEHVGSGLFSLDLNDAGPTINYISALKQADGTGVLMMWTSADVDYGVEGLRSLHRSALEGLSREQ